MQTFLGNRNYEAPHITLLETPVIAKYIRVLPETWPYSYAGLRFGCLGLPSNSDVLEGTFAFHLT